MENTREKVAIVATALRQAGVICHVFGGWAEEILGVRAPSTHGDIDLLYCGEDFQVFDRVLRELPDFQEVPQKRFRHKRAFRFLGTVCELTLVQGPEERPTTLFWGDVPYAWESPLLHGSLVEICGEPISVVSAANLVQYRENHKATQPHRWREPQALEPYA
ncbi:hypothetical protein [Rhizobium sp. BK376]|uniref:hypothetical protein n=1 Tax=Rhizobium sp. BK376 TaxID=2512149 RepID=UPI001FE22F74|nr:hypothetical protein [Rhizobium sp. BK376]